MNIHWKMYKTFKFNHCSQFFQFPPISSLTLAYFSKNKMLEKIHHITPHIYVENLHLQRLALIFLFNLVTPVAWRENCSNKCLVIECSVTNLNVKLLLLFWLFAFCVWRSRGLYRLRHSKKVLCKQTRRNSQRNHFLKLNVQTQPYVWQYLYQYIALYFLMNVTLCNDFTFSSICRASVNIWRECTKFSHLAVCGFCNHEPADVQVFVCSYSAFIKQI